MLVSTKGRYGLRMMVDIARNQGADAQTRVSLREIGERQGISAKYLEQLARFLCAEGLLIGSRGQGGGYVLGRAADDIKVGDVLRATEGSLAPVTCMTLDDTMCPRREACEIISFWRGLDLAIASYVDSYTIADLVRAIEANGDACPAPCLGQIPERPAASRKASEKK